MTALVALGFGGSMRSRQVTAYLEPALYDALEQKASTEGQSMSNYMRMLVARDMVRNHLVTWQQLVPGSAEEASIEGS